ncbi:hypothetical protein P4B35_10800 [Pontiellaceae bacterium B12227]|nr:hypothetical protein [Pontiellaceae bacterium B12227]
MKPSAFDTALFDNPPAEYRGAPFWAWNCDLDEEELLRQIGIFQEMGIGGFHMHSRTGMNVPYLSDEFMVRVRACVDEASRRGMKAWLYDEDRWPSGFGGGRVTENPEYRAKYILFTQRPYGTVEKEECNIPNAAASRSENGVLLSRYAVVLKDGCLVEYRRFSEDEEVPEQSQCWYAYLETAPSSEWFNGQAYVNTLKKEATECFIRSTHERYKEAVGDEFGKTVPGIFTDEPQFAKKQYFNSPEDRRDLIIPFTEECFDAFSARSSCDFLDALPEIFWELPGRKASVHRYGYHDCIAELFARNYAGTIGAWCRENRLSFTGHLMNEPTLESQTGSLGEAMRSYIEFDRPGIDIINDYFEYTSAKQAQSVARQNGSPGITSELYGVTNWDYDFKGHKAQGDWQAALGVVLRVHHLTWVSMKGEAKRDYPASIGYQSPWYQKYSVVEDHFARVNLMMTQGRPRVRVGVIHPIESFWLAYGPSSQTGRERAHREEQFDLINRMLLFGLIDYDLICESLLPRQCALDRIGQTFPVGEMEYEVIVVPGMKTIRSTTLDALERFAAVGGRIVFAGEVPSLVDAVPSPRPAELAAECTVTEFSNYGIQQHLSEVRDIQVFDEIGAPADHLLYQMRAVQDERVLFLCNSSRTEAKENLQIDITGEWICTELNTQTGNSAELSAVYKDGVTRIQYELHPAGSLLLKLAPGRGKEPEAKPVPPSRPEVVLPPPDSYELSEPNVLLLDQAQWQWNDEALQPKEEILRIDNLLRTKLLLKQRDGLGRQAWCDREPAPVLGTLTLRFDFESRRCFHGCELALEDAEQIEITLNSEAVSKAPSGWWVDRCIRKVPLPEIKEGQNTLCLKIAYTRKTDLEWVYLLGGFGVQLMGDRAVLTDLPQQLPYGNWTQFGLPFYAGNIDYKIVLPQRDIQSVQFPFFKGALLEIFLNGELVAPVAFPPYELQLPRLDPEKGHVLTVRVYGNRVNAFGSVHNTDEQRNDWVRYGPLGYRSEGKDWAYEYQLRPMGLLTAPLARSDDGESGK